MTLNDKKDESCDEKIVSSDALVTHGQNQEPQQMHISQTATPFLSQSATPSKALLLGQNGEDV